MKKSKHNQSSDNSKSNKHKQGRRGDKPCIFLFASLAVFVALDSVWLQRKIFHEANGGHDVGVLDEKLTELALMWNNIAVNVSRLDVISSTPTRVKKHSTFLEVGDEHDYPPICLTLPGDGDPDDHSVKYHLLRRIQHLLATQPGTKKEPGDSVTTKLLCIFPFFRDDREHAAVDTFGRECDGALLLRDKNDMTEYQDIDYGIPLEILRLDPSSEDWKEELDQHLLSSTQQKYGWIHWASPTRYTFVGLVRLAIQQQAGQQARQHARQQARQQANKAGNTASCFETWFGENFIFTKYFKDLDKYYKSDCSMAWVWNWEATKQILPNCSKIALETKFNSSSGAIECHQQRGLVCATVQTKSKWDRLKQFFQIRTFGDSQQLYRIHAILTGVCDAYWDRYLGALDEQGRPGYVHDPTFLRNNPPKLNLSDGNCNVSLGQGDEGPSGAEGMVKIRTDLPESMQTKKVLCMVYTHEGRHAQVAAVAETWGPKCDGFLAASNKTDRSIGAVNILHEGPEAYDNMWMKVVSIFKYAHKHYINDFDFFHIGGDDMYVIAENLRYTISTGNWKAPWNTSEPLMLGGSVALSSKLRFCGGGGGYTLNKVALRLFAEKLYSDPECRPHWRGPEEDIWMAKCFFYATGMQCMDTNDEKFEARYHPFTADMHARWTKKDHNSKLLEERFYHNITIKAGLGQISERSTTFHLKRESRVKKLHLTLAEDMGMRRFHAIVYNLCPSDSKLGVSLKR
ncbi:hypothetical protein ACA910_021965 [Epithemia clementina (nom. ined.)]